MPVDGVCHGNRKVAAQKGDDARVERPAPRGASRKVRVEREEADNARKVEIKPQAIDTYSDHRQAQAGEGERVREGLPLVPQTGARGLRQSVAARFHVVYEDEQAQAVNECTKGGDPCRNFVAARCGANGTG